MTAPTDRLSPEQRKAIQMIEDGLWIDITGHHVADLRQLAAALEREAAVRAELRAVDMVLERRDALDDAPNRVDKILRCIDVAKQNDPAAKLLATSKERDKAVAEAGALRAERDALAEQVRALTAELAEEKRCLDKTYDERDEAQYQRDATTAALAQAREALEWYANEETHVSAYGEGRGRAAIILDKGTKARQALAALPAEGTPKETK